MACALGAVERAMKVREKFDRQRRAQSEMEVVPSEIEIRQFRSLLNLERNYQQTGPGSLGSPNTPKNVAGSASFRHPRCAPQGEARESQQN